MGPEEWRIRPAEGRQPLGMCVPGKIVRRTPDHSSPTQCDGSAHEPDCDCSRRRQPLLHEWGGLPPRPADSRDSSQREEDGCADSVSHQKPERITRDRRQAVNIRTASRREHDVIPPQPKQHHLTHSPTRRRSKQTARRPSPTRDPCPQRSDGT